MKNKLWGAVVALALVMTVSCGKNRILDAQEGQRADITAELPGNNWASRCEDSQIVTLTFDAGKMTVQREYFYDAECRDPRRTVSQTGQYSLASNFKDGILNSIVFIAGKDFTVTLRSDSEVDVQSGSISKVQNEKETPIEISMSPSTKRNVNRENERIRETKQLTMWRVGEAKTLNRLQVEKLNSYALSERPFVDFEARAAFRYELDNGFLQVSIPQVGTRVYTKP